MAIKDWEKSYVDEDTIVWQNSFTLRRIQISLQKNKKRETIGWTFYPPHVPNRKTEKSKPFKTKFKALRYAKAYMRTH